MADDKVLYIRDIIQRSDIPRELIPVFEKLRVEAFTTAQKVYDDRTVGYNIDHPPYEEMIYGPLSLVSEIFKRARRLAALLSPIRTEPLRGADMNRMIDLCVDLINYLSWTYALLILASGYEGHLNSDDSNDYVGLRGGNQ